MTTPELGSAPLRLLIANGEEASAAVERLCPDLVILDVRMPILDEVEATLRIKARWPSVRIVAHSSAVERRADALAAGADAFVPRGAPTDQLLGALRAGRATVLKD